MNTHTHLIRYVYYNPVWYRYDIGINRYDIGMEFHTDFIGMISVCKRFIPISYRFHTGLMDSYRFYRYLIGMKVHLGYFPVVGLAYWYEGSYRFHTDFIPVWTSIPILSGCYRYEAAFIPMKPSSSVWRALHTDIIQGESSYRFHTGLIGYECNA